MHLRMRNLWQFWHLWQWEISRDIGPRPTTEHMLPPPKNLWAHIEKNPSSEFWAKLILFATEKKTVCCTQGCDKNPWNVRASSLLWNCVAKFAEGSVLWGMHKLLMHDDAWWRRKAGIREKLLAEMPPVVEPMAIWKDVLKFNPFLPFAPPGAKH